MADVQAKYQKLASEYAKLRAQVPILKKAVVDEQGTNEELKESLKDKELSIRKFEQEIDSLTFRNQQLASRVTVLQEELNDPGQASKGKKNKKHQPEPPARQSSVIGEELQSKIEENARLHKQVHEADTEYRQRVSALQDRLAQLEAEASQHENVLQAAQKETKGKIEKLQEDCIQFQVKLQKHKTEAREATSAAQSLEKELKTTKTKLGAELQTAKDIIHNKITFNDSEKDSLNALNIPFYDRRHQSQTRELVQQANSIIKDFVQYSSNYFTYNEQRVASLPVDEDIKQKLVQHLHENLSVLKPIEVTFGELVKNVISDTLTTLDSATGLNEVINAFHTYVIYNSKLISYQITSLEYENAMSTCTANLEAKNEALVTALRHLDKVLVNVDSLLQQLCSSTEKSTATSLPQSEVMNKLSEAFVAFHDAFKDVSKHYNAKVSLEHQLPTSSHKIQVTDECIVAALVNLVKTTHKLSLFFVNNLDVLCQPVLCTSIGCRNPSSVIHPAIDQFRQASSEYMAMISRPCPESVPYESAIQNRKILFSSTESRESLSQQVVNQQEKLNKLEQDKEHWRLESQLLQMRLEKETLRVNELMNKVDSSGDVAPQNHTEQDASPSESLLGRLETTESFNDSESREHLIREHYSERINEMTLKLQMADSKALHFQAECRALHRRLRLLEKEKVSSTDEASQSQQSIAQLKDELQTTTKSYEGQLSMMSEHLANMNEKLTAQKDEIDALRYQVQNPVKSNSKRGIGKLVR